MRSALAGTVGLPLPGVDVRITDPVSGEPLDGSEVGMIEGRGLNVFKGYWRMPEKTSAEFWPDGFLITGDLGKTAAAPLPFTTGYGLLFGAMESAFRPPPASLRGVENGSGSELLACRRRLAAPHDTWPVIGQVLSATTSDLFRRAACRLLPLALAMDDGQTLHRRINVLNRSALIDS